MINKDYINKLAQIIREDHTDAIILGPSEDLEYITGFQSHPDERFQGFVLLADGRYFYISPKLNTEEIKNAFGEDIQIFSWDDRDGFLGAVQRSAAEYNLKGKRIAINSAVRGTDLIDIRRILSSELINGTNTIENSRIIKTKEEIQHLKEAAQMADAVMEDLITFIRPGLREKDIKAKIEELFWEKGSDGLAFEPIVASGPNSSKPHYNQDSRKVTEKDIIVLDLGCKYRGCCSDISRTFFIGDITTEESEIYNIIRAANTQGKEAVKEGVTAECVDKRVRDVIKNAGYGDFFLNRTGHGIGFSVHEAPYIREGNKQVLKKGMAFSIEPGIYLPLKYGMRIEDIVILGEHGTEVINQFSREIIVI